MTKRHAKRIVKRIKPFRGAHSYESQIGPIVVQVRHRGGAENDWLGHFPFRPARVNVFTDPYWRI